MSVPVSFGLKLPNCAGMMCPPEWARPDTIVDLARRAQRSGYSSAWLHEHLLMPAEYEHLGNAHLYDPSVVMATVLASVPDIVVGTAAVVLPLSEPVSLARRMMTMQSFHPGRAVFGLGAGQYASEFAAFGTDLFDKRGRVMEEYLRLIDDLVDSGMVTFDGEFRSLAGARFHPTAAAVGRPPIWIAGNAAPAIRRAARFGDGWISVAKSPEELGECVAMLKEHLGSGRRDAGRPFHVAMSTTVVREDAGRAARAGLHEHRRVVRGDAAEICADLAAYADAGVDTFILTFGANALEEVHEDLEWFASEVVGGFARHRHDREAVVD